MNYIKTHWLEMLVAAQLVLIIGGFWYVQDRLVLHEKAMIIQHDNTQQIVDFLNQAIEASKNK